MKRRFLIRGSCLVLAIGMILAGTGCEKRKRVPEDMTLGDEYLEKIVLRKTASGIMSLRQRK